MNRGELRRCPKCLQSWPRQADHDLRGFGWLHDLPRHVSLSNADALLHDGHHGRDRFLMLEVKMPWEPELQVGQGWLLRSIANQGDWTVRLLHALRGERATLRYHRVDPNRGVTASGIIVERERFRAAVVHWLDGGAWEDPRGEPEPEPRGHICGWAQVEGEWRCIQDHYAVGFRPETGCGATWAQP